MILKARRNRLDGVYMWSCSCLAGGAGAGGPGAGVFL